MEEQTTDQKEKENKDEQPEALKSYQTMPEPKRQGKSKATLIAVAILVAIIAGGGVWYCMNHKNQTDKKASNKSISALQASITSLNSQLATAKTATTTTTTAKTTTTATLNELDKLRTFCQGTDPDTLVTGITFVQLSSTNTYEYGDCGIGSKSHVGGGHIIAIYSNSSWTKVWEGNGFVDQATCTKYSLPVANFQATCQ